MNPWRHSPTNSPSLSRRRHCARSATPLSRVSGALLLTAEEAVRTLAPEDLELMREITRDRDSLVDHLRRRVIEAERGLTATDQRHLYTITSSFELIVWMLRRLTALLAPQVAPALEQRLALEVAPETG